MPQSDVAEDTLEPTSSPQAAASAKVGHAIAQEVPERFDAFPMAAALKEAVAAMGYTTPTPVQAHVIRPATQGADLLVQSKTGSGKTCAFGLPLLERIGTRRAPSKRPLAMVLAPTRELAGQVADELTSLAQHLGTRVLAVYGGVPMGKQNQALERGVEVVVATPGRLLDHLRRGNVELKTLDVVVLDEADEMLSMGFWEDVTALIRATPKERQTLLFSATLPYEVVRTAAHLLRDPVRVDLSGDDLSVDGIDNRILHVLPNIPKPRQMLYVLEGARAQSAIIFCNTRNETEMLAKYLTQLGFGAEPLSGNFKQKERDRTMARIKSGELRYMVATDIAARGIDINDLSHVFNYSLPEFCEVYLHRVGRTGRAGKVGSAISLVDGKGLATLTVLERDFGVQFTEMVLPPEQEVIRARSTRIMKELLERAQVAELGQHLPVAQSLLNEEGAAQAVAFLLKQYFAQQANSIRPATAQEAPEVDEAPQGGGDDGDEASMAQGAGQGRKRRRRRGRRRGGEGQEPGAEEMGPIEPHSPPAATQAAYDIIDAVVLLGGAPAPEPAPQPQPQERQARAPRPPRGQGEPRRERQERPERGNRRRERGPNQQRRRGGQAGVYTGPMPELNYGDDDDRGNVALPKAPATPPPPPPPAPEGQAHIRVNLGFDDGFKGRGAVAKRVAALAGLNEGTLSEVESRRDYAILLATPEIAEMVLDRVDGAQLGKKVIAVTLG